MIIYRANSSFLFYLLLLFFTPLLTSCTSEFGNSVCERGLGTRVERDFVLPEIRGVAMNMDGTVYIERGQETQIRVIGQENMIARLSQDVDEDGVWRIELEGCTRKVLGFDIYLTIPELDILRLNNHSEIVVRDTFEGTKLDVSLTGSGAISVVGRYIEVDQEITGSGTISAYYETNKLATKLTGSGSAVLAGSSRRHLIEILGSGDVEAFALETLQSEVQISGSGDAYITVENDLKVDITGSGDVFYKGRPVIDVSISGSGELINDN